MLINIWESIIAAPKDICFQSITKSELRELIVNIQNIVFDITLPKPDLKHRDILLRVLVESHLNYCTSVINKLGGKVV